MGLKTIQPVHSAESWTSLDRRTGRATSSWTIHRHSFGSSGPTGDSQKAVLPRGQGPGESRGPYAVAGDSSGFMILDQGMKLFDWSGNLLLEGRVSGTMSLAVIAGCRGNWFVYGPGGDPAQWLHAMSVLGPDSIVSEGFYVDSARATRLGLGKVYGLGRNGSHYLLYHENGRPRRVVEWTCEELRPRRVAALDYLIPEPEQTETRAVEGGAILTMTASPEEPQFAGLAALDGGVLWTGVVLKMSLPTAEPTAETWFRLVEDSVEYSAAVEGAFRLHDRTPDGALLFSTVEPFPQVVAVPEQEVMVALRRGAKRSLDGSR